MYSIYNKHDNACKDMNLLCLYCMYVCVDVFAKMTFKGWNAAWVDVRENSIKDDDQILA